LVAEILIERVQVQANFGDCHVAKSEHVVCDIVKPDLPKVLPRSNTWGDGGRQMVEAWLGSAVVARPSSYAGIEYISEPKNLLRVQVQKTLAIFVPVCILFESANLITTT